MDDTRLLRRRLASLYATMERMGEEHMGDLSYAEASLFHGSTDLIHRLIYSINDRVNKAAKEVSDV